jgi:integrase
MTDDVVIDIPPSVKLAATLPASLSTPLDQNPATVYLMSLSEGSRPTMRTALNTIAGILGTAERRDALGHDVRCFDVPWAALRRQHTLAIRDQLRERYALATAKKLLAALRRVLREARRLGQLSAEEYSLAVDLGSIRAEPQPRGRLITEGEVVALLQSCANDPTHAGARDAAIIAVLRGAGLRRAEAAGLDLDDYNAANGTLIVRGSKGKQDLRVFLPDETRAAVSAWLVVRGDAPGPLFYGVVKGGSLVPRRLAGQAMAVICASRGLEAGIEPLTPHDLRRTFLSGLLDSRD